MPEGPVCCQFPHAIPLSSPPPASAPQRFEELWGGGTKGEGRWKEERIKEEEGEGRRETGGGRGEEGEGRRERGGGRGEEGEGKRERGGGE